MKLATTLEERRRWMQQWHQAAIALEEVRHEELVNLTEEEAWAKTERLLDLVKYYHAPTDTSGFVEQQAWFQKRRR